MRIQRYEKGRTWYRTLIQQRPRTGEEEGIVRRMTNIKYVDWHGTADGINSSGVGRPCVDGALYWGNGIAWVDERSTKPQSVWEREDGIW